MITEDNAKKQLETLHQEGSALAEEFGVEQLRLQKLYEKRGLHRTNGVIIRRFSRNGEEKEEEQTPEPLPTDETHFEERYQNWYSRALPLMKQLAQDRYGEFQSFYVVDPRYPWGKKDAYVIQDYFRHRGSDDSGAEAVRCFKNQLAILKSVVDRIPWMALDTEDQSERSLQLTLLKAARGLIKISEQAAGVLAGVVLESYLRRLAAKHQVKSRKESPPVGELVEALKAAKVFDVPVWSQATWLAEIRERCQKAGGEVPTKLQVRDLVDGTQWLITHVF